MTGRDPTAEPCKCPHCDGDGVVGEVVERCVPQTFDDPGWCELEGTPCVMCGGTGMVSSGRKWELRPARDGIEAQRGLNDVFPGDLTPVRKER